MTYVLGIDLGACSTGAAILRPGSGEDPAPLGLGVHTPRAASALFLAADGRVLAGDAAESRGWECPERLARGFKARVGDSVPLAVGEALVPAEELYAALARWVVTTVEAREGAPAAAVALTHPRGWGGYRVSVARRALAEAGLAHALLLSEPEAAALHHAAGTPLDPGAMVAVCNLGGSVEATVLRRGAGTDRGAADFETLGRSGGPARDLGAELDEAVFAHVLDALGGPAGEPDTGDPRVASALAQVRRECATAKEALAGGAEATVKVVLPGARKQVRITPEEFEALAGNLLRGAADILGQALRSARVSVRDLAAVILTGGTAAIPLAARILAEEAPGAVAADADPASVTARGAALAAAGHLKAGVGTEAVVASVLRVHGTAVRPHPDDLGLLLPAPPTVEAGGVLYIPVPRTRQRIAAGTGMTAASGASRPGA
ncbi:molecular chaperone DnaK [Zafaria cholistanensis]|uniref:Molecular chaperone DnaK n=1 Tax=Zafaria cholistanensis TaxID=1682741 RepID=A0A5A7NUD2_9MICC|nr:Hsp70 family protein [Zafaria cholistanensis]GER23457.1 molecular chaperone DnaK [Zafaria cholistanensis]